LTVRKLVSGYVEDSIVSEMGWRFFPRPLTSSAPRWETARIWSVPEAVDVMGRAGVPLGIIATIAFNYKLAAANTHYGDSIVYINNIYITTVVSITPIRVPGPGHYNVVMLRQDLDGLAKYAIVSVSEMRDKRVDVSSTGRMIFSIKVNGEPFSSDATIGEVNDAFDRRLADFINSIDWRWKDGER